MQHKCRICGNSDNNQHYVGTETKMGLNEAFYYFKCSHCACLQIEKYPDNIAKYYQGYHSFNNKIVENIPFYKRFLATQLVNYRLKNVI